MSEYPTKETLKQIEKWNVEKGTAVLLGLLQDIWYWEDYLKLKQKGNKFKLELHTGGWSGNEEIIRALRASDFWMVYWQKSERGGHYYFEGKLFDRKVKG